MSSPIEISRDLKVVTILRGNRGPKQAKQALLCSQKDFNDFFEGEPPAIELPGGFFGVIALGERRSGGFYVTVNNAYQITFGIATGLVHINFSEDKSSGPHTDALTYPFVVFNLPDLQYATSAVFNKIEKQVDEGSIFSTLRGNGTKFIVIALTITGDDCKTIPEGSYYPMIYSQVFGPASYEDCEEYRKETCGH